MKTKREIVLLWTYKYQICDRNKYNNNNKLKASQGISLKIVSYWSCLLTKEFDFSIFIPTLSGWSRMIAKKEKKERKEEKGDSTFNSSLAESGSMTGLKERECGQIGVNSMHGTFGWTCITYHASLATE